MNLIFNNLTVSEQRLPPFGITARPYCLCPEFGLCCCPIIRINRAASVRNSTCSSSITRLTCRIARRRHISSCRPHETIPNVSQPFSAGGSILVTPLARRTGQRAAHRRRTAENIIRSPNRKGRPLSSSQRNARLR